MTTAQGLSVSLVDSSGKMGGFRTARLYFDSGHARSHDRPRPPAPLSPQAGAALTRSIIRGSGRPGSALCGRSTRSTPAAAAVNPLLNSPKNDRPECLHPAA
jgi:hypothetical protein